MFLIYAYLYNMFSFILCVFVYAITWFNKKMILVNKFIQHKYVNDPCCEIKYLDLHPSLDFFNFIFS
jgi:hypothetical protein